MFKKLLNFLLWPLFFPCLLIASFYLSWESISSQKFLYGFWYDNTKLESFIDHYSPQNRYKEDFELTNREERIRLFSEILIAVNSRIDESEELSIKEAQVLGLNTNLNEGVSSSKIYEYRLSSIKYFTPKGIELDKLLRHQEVKHLVFVAELISKFKKTALLAIICLIVIISFMAITRMVMPSLKRLLTVYTVLISIIVLIIFIVSPLNIFVYFHEQFFEGHQWFFYYQDSLMTTLMMAPDLFAYFASLWVFLTLILFFSMSILFVKTFTKLTKLTKLSM